MLGSLLKSFNDEFNEINSYSDALFEDFSQTISLEENDDLIDAYPFTQCKTQKFIKKVIFETFNTIKRSRKDKEDDIRKKLKSSFHRNLRIIINKKLKEANSKYLLESLPQNFITDVTKRTNYEVMYLRYEELFDYTYNQVIVENKNNKGKKYIEKRNKAAKKKYEKNKKLFDYLCSNKKISEESGWEKIKNMKYIDLFKAYLNSNEFQEYIKILFKNENIYYIKDFIYFASTFIKHYLNYEPKENNSQKNDISHSEVSNNTYVLSISELMPFPPSFLEMIEDDNNMLGSLDSARNLDNDSIDNTNIFIGENSIFERDNYL